MAAFAESSSIEAILTVPDLDACLFNNTPDNLAAGADDVPNPVRFYLHGKYTWRVGRQVVSRLLDCRFHDIEYLHDPFLSLNNGPGHGVLCNALDLNIHLNSGNSFSCPGNLEIHIAEVVFITQDIGEDDFRVSLTRPMAIPATGSLMGTPASMRERHPPQTVAIEEEPFDSSISETIRMV